jgi:hypothetical protein
MQDTVDQATAQCHAPWPASSRTRAGPCAATAARQPSMGVLILRHRLGWAAPGEVRRG